MKAGIPTSQTALNPCSSPSNYSACRAKKKTICVRVHVHVCVKEKGGKRNTLFTWHLFRNIDITDVRVADLLCKNGSETEEEKAQDKWVRDFMGQCEGMTPAVKHFPSHH